MKSAGNTPKGNHREFFHPDDTPWTDWLMPGTQFKLLYCNLATGQFTLMIKVAPNTQATSHWHVGHLQVYIVEGGFYYGDGSFTKDGVTVEDKGRPGSYTAEVAGTVHQPLTTDSGCIMLAIFDGPIGGYAPDGALGVIADARLHYYLARENSAVKDTQIVDYAHGTTTLDSVVRP